jgi:stress response protein YsnF
VTVDEREEIVTEQLMRDDLQIEHVPKNVRVSEVPQVRVEGNTTIVPVVKEVVVVEKALMLVEEIRISRHSVAEHREIPVTLRSERAHVERDPGAEPARAEE